MDLTPSTYPFRHDSHNTHKEDHHREKQHQEARMGGPTARLVGIIFGCVFGALILGLVLRMIFDRTRRSQLRPTQDSTYPTNNQTSNQDFSISVRDQIEPHPSSRPWNQTHKRVSSLGKGYGRGVNEPSRISLNPEGFDSRDIGLLPLISNNGTISNEEENKEELNEDKQQRREESQRVGQKNQDNGWESSSQIDLNEPPSYAHSNLRYQSGYV